jgi:hypothetical protein
MYYGVRISRPGQRGILGDFVAWRRSRVVLQGLRYDRSRAVQHERQGGRAGVSGSISFARNDSVLTIREASRLEGPGARAVRSGRCRNRNAIEGKGDDRIGIARPGQRGVVGDFVSWRRSRVVLQGLGHRRDQNYFSTGSPIPQCLESCTIRIGQASVSVIPLLVTVNILLFAS